LRIVHVVRQYYPSCGGLEDVVRNLVLAQKSAGRDVSVVTLDTNFQTNQKLEANALVDGVPVQRIGYVGSRRYSFAPTVRDYLADADIVHVHAIDFFIDYLALLKRRGKLRARLVVSTHGGIFHTRTLIWLKQLFFRTITPFSLQQADAVIASSYADKVLFEPIARHTTVIENGVSLKKFGTAVCSATANGFLCLGRFSDNKNLLNLVRWFAAARRTDRSLRLYIAGRADQESVQELIECARLLGAEQGISIVPNPSDSAICALIEQCRFVISASTYEGFGLSVPELMSYGMVPVLSNIPSFRHFVERAGFGCLFEFSEASFIAALQAAIAAHSPAHAARAAQFAEQYAWVAVARQFAAVYDA
jgi:alpha-1,3-mannosyltransferase